MRLAALVPVAALYAAVGWTSPGYDDEIFNIVWIGQAAGYRDLLALVASRDIHPPGSYLLGMALRDLGLGWSAIRALTGLATAFALWRLWCAAAPAGRGAAGFAWLATCLNPTMLMWGATLRWYSFFLPLAIGVMLLILAGPAGRWRFWGLFAAAAAGLFYLGYFALILLPPLAAAALWRRRVLIRDEWPAILGCAALWLAAVAPQVWLVLPDQIGRGFAVHDLGPARQVLGALMHMLAGQASMPLSGGAVAFVLGNLLLLGLGLRGAWGAAGSVGAIVALGGAAGAFAAGITTHFRPLVLLSPAQSVWQAALFGTLRPGARAAVALCFATGTVAGLVNVVSHRDTTKGSWNTPYPEILAGIEAAREDCPALAVMAFDPVLNWHLEQRGIVRARPVGEALAARMSDAGACLATVETFRGTTPRAAHRRFAEAIAARPGLREVRDFGHDRHAWFKRRFDPDVPDHAARLTIFPGTSVAGRAGN